MYFVTLQHCCIAWLPISCSPKIASWRKSTIHNGSLPRITGCTSQIGCHLHQEPISQYRPLVLAILESCSEFRWNLPPHCWWSYVMHQEVWEWCNLQVLLWISAFVWSVTHPTCLGSLEFLSWLRAEASKLHKMLVFDCLAICTHVGWPRTSTFGHMLSRFHPQWCK